MRYIPEFGRRVYDHLPVSGRSAAASLYGALKNFRENTPRFAAFLRELEASQTWNIGRLEELQADRLRRIVRHAAEHVPYYRSLFGDHGINPTQIQTLPDLCRVPILTKETLRSNPTALLTEGTDVSRLQSESTSGTTGSPLTIWTDRDTYLSHRAAQWLHHSWAGYSHREWIGVLAGYKVLPAAHKRPPFWVTNLAGRQIHFSSYHLNPEWIPAFVGKLRCAGLQFLLGYPSAIGLLAHHVAALGHFVPLKAVFLSSEPVLQWQADAIRSAFGAAIFHYYGSTERAVSAGSCEDTREAGSMHVNMEICIAECVDDPAVAGCRRIVGTSLTNYTMPLIRYETGDVTSLVPHACACGRNHPRIGPIQTRTADYLMTPSGTLVSPWLVTRVFAPEKSLVAFQIVQEDIHHLDIRVVPGVGYSTEDEERLRRNIQGQIGAGIVISFTRVGAIERNGNGKVRVVVSHVLGDSSSPASLAC